MPIAAKRHLTLLVLLSILLGLASARFVSASTPASPTALFSGYVRDKLTGAPIDQARVAVGSVTIITGRDGLIRATPIPLRGAVDQVDITVSAAGYLPWNFRGLTLRAGQPVEMHALLRRADATAPPSGPALGPPAPKPGDSAPPAYIRIGRTYTADCVVPDPSENIPVDTMPFVDYIRNVLPNEWLPGWDVDGSAALDAGAVAVKQYAWYNAFVAPKWSGQGYAFDLLDNTCDQRFIDRSADPRTDAAISRTWPATLKRNDALFSTYYRAYYFYQCFAPQTSEGSPIPDCLGQWDSYYAAVQGKTAQQILLDAYGPAQYTLPTLRPRVYVPLIQNGAAPPSPQNFAAPEAPQPLPLRGSLGVR